MISSIILAGVLLNNGTPASARSIQTPCKNDIFTLDLSDVKLAGSDNKKIKQYLEYLDKRGYDYVRLDRSSRSEIRRVQHIKDEHKINITIIEGKYRKTDRGRGGWYEYDGWSYDKGGRRTC